MCDVTQSTFEDAFPLMERSIKDASFIAIDTEFTGLVCDQQSKPSLFDTSDERYKKLRRSVSRFSMSQIGLTAFVKVPGANRYEAHCYNCWVRPVAFGPIDPKFSVQVSSLSFLAQHDFSFNKFLYEGVPMMNTQQEAEVARSLETTGDAGLDRDVDERALRAVCSAVGEWSATAAVGDTHTLPLDASITQLVWGEYLLHSELRTRFPHVWSTSEDMRTVVVRKVGSEEREKLEQTDPHNMANLRQRLQERLLGFTRVFRVLTKYKKPLVGHNMMMDLLYFYHYLYAPLPGTLKEFKTVINEMFPLIYDTKHMVLNLRRDLENDYDVFRQTSLGDLYSAFKTKKMESVMFRPVVVFGNGFDKYREGGHLHEAGYDAFMCGHVFMNLAHLCALTTIPASQMGPQEFPRYLIKVAAFLNRVNIIRAAHDYICIDGPEPPSRRPQWLYVSSRHTHPLSATRVAQELSGYGSVDVRMAGVRAAFVAVNSHKGARDIVRQLKSHSDLSAASYNPLKHSRPLKAALWTGLAVLTGVCTWALLGTKPSKIK